MARTHACTPAIHSGRRSKSRQFWDAAEAVRAPAYEAADVADAYVTLLIHASMAAADVICCARLGEHAQGESHDEAVTLLAKVDGELSKALGVVLSLKTKSGHSHLSASADDIRRAERAARKLVDAMNATPKP